MDLEILLDEYYKKYLERHTRYHVLTPEAREKILSFQWDNNDVQLESFCERMILTATRRKISGEYVQDLLGSSIVLYYGSFAQVFGDATRSAMEKELRKTLRHEFRHHIEAMAGADDLDVEDARRMEEYRREDEAYRRGKPEAKK